MNWFFNCYELQKKRKKVELFDFNCNKISEYPNTLIDHPDKNIYINARIADNEHITLVTGPLQKYSDIDSIYFRNILLSECNLKEYSNPKSVIIHIYPNKDPIYILYTGESSCVIYNLQISLNHLI